MILKGNKFTMSADIDTPAAIGDQEEALQQMNVAVVGHVDHGKSTVVGRLMADTGSLPEGKLEQVRATCERNAKPFEYAFLLDALKDEQAQGITIDMARCFFKTDERRYLILDAPGHVEFLRNMITGASRAEAVLIVIDANEGIRENSKRHGYIVSMLGIPQVTVLVNKMDLADYSEDVFNQIRKDYTEFLGHVNVQPTSFIPVSGFHGDNIASPGDKMPWYDGNTVLQQFDAFDKLPPPSDAPFRFPLQDIYRFTESGDDRRLFAGTVRSGTIRVGDQVRFLPSNKESVVKSVEQFNAPDSRIAQAGQALGFTLDTQLYLKPGEIMVRTNEPQPQVGTRFRANLFWMGRAPLIKGKRYKLKIGTARVSVELVKVLNVLDASELTSESNKKEVERHDVGEILLESPKPLAFDLVDENPSTGRFVIIDNHEIAGAGIVLENVKTSESILADHVRDREFAWDGSPIKDAERSMVYGHGAKFLVITGADAERVENLATTMEKLLFYRNFKAFYLSLSNVQHGLDADISFMQEARYEHVRRLGELARILTASGQIFITALPEAEPHELRILELLNKPNEIAVVNLGANPIGDFPISLSLDEDIAVTDATDRVMTLLKEKNVILDYVI